MAAILAITTTTITTGQLTVAIPVTTITSLLMVAILAITMALLTVGKINMRLPVVLLHMNMVAVTRDTMDSRMDSRNLRVLM